jgi:SRSO17 transposase
MSLSSTAQSWQVVFERWLDPFLSGLGNRFRREMAPIYLKGLLAPGRRKSVEPMARRVAQGNWQKLHHFVAVSQWDTAALMKELVVQANVLVGGEDAFLIVDDTALRKKGRHSAGVARQYCGETGKIENCQSLVSLALSRGEVPIPVALGLFLPESWDEDSARRAKCGIPVEVRHREKWRIALEEIDRVRSAGARFGSVLADAGYGNASGFRAGLSGRDLLWTVGVEAQQKVYPVDVALQMPPATERGRPRKHPAPSVSAVSAREFIESLGPEAFDPIAWRRGTKGPLSARFAAVRVRAADGAKISRGVRLPGEEVWLVCEWRASGEKKYYFSNLPADATRAELARTIKARWSCEQTHQQMKQELGLDHYEGRSWMGLHHHCLLTMIAFCFLQHLRLEGKKGALVKARRPRRVCQPCGAS